MPWPAELESRPVAPGRSGSAKSRWLVAAVVLVALVLLGVVAVLGFVKPGFFVPTVAHQTSVRSGPDSP
ncbi:MAG: hypothetical protein QOI50_6076 [Pseudonocardiales bacterium]|nr:hypothetical protein [Pseudonocardiales bacterium]MDT7773609.1 hypothetical protein [Pseudonocardiales bacterium]